MIASLDLDCGVLDAIHIVQVTCNIGEECIVLDAAGDYEMGSQRGVGRAQCPDVKVVEFSYAGQSGEIALNPLGIGPGRNRLKRHVDGVP